MTDPKKTVTVHEWCTARRKTIEAGIAVETLAGNTYKQDCERTALAEITSLEIALARGEVRHD